MKNILFTFLLGCLTQAMYSQNIAQTNQVWTKLHETNEVLFETCKVQCTDYQEGIDQIRQLIRITNKTPELVSVSWLNALYYDGNCLTCKNLTEYTNQLELAPKLTITGSCDGQPKYLSIFSSDNKSFIKEKLTQLKIQGLTTSTIKN